MPVIAPGLEHLLLDSDWEWIRNSVRLNQFGYPIVGKKLLHKIVMADVFLSGLEIDHVNRDPLDCRRENLRLASRGQNLANRRGWSVSGFKGVYRYGKRWRAQTSYQKKRIHLGVFDTPEEAAIAFDDFVVEKWLEFAKTNY